MKMVNVLEEIAWEVLNEHWDHLDLSCKCEQCKGDVYALMMNALPPRYVTTDAGRVFIKVEFMNEQSLTNVLCQLAKAAEIVAVKPSHPHPKPDVPAVAE